MDNLNSAEKRIDEQIQANDLQKSSLAVEESVFEKSLIANRDLINEQTASATIGTLELGGLDEESDAVQITSSAELERQLELGYEAAGVAKAEKDQWAMQLRAQIQEAKARENEAKRRKKSFKDASVTTMMERTQITKETLRILRNQNQDTIDNLTNVMRGVIAQSFIDFSKLSESENPKISSIASFINEMTSLDMSKLEEGYDALLERYNSFEGINRGIYKEQMEKIAPEMKLAGYSMMLSSAVKYLGELVTQNRADVSEEDSVNIQVLALSTDLVNSELLISQEYRDQIKEYYENRAGELVASGEKLEEEKELINARKEQIRTGGIEDEEVRAEKWKLSKYGDQIIIELGDGLLDMEQEELDTLLVKYNDNIIANERAIRDVLLNLKFSYPLLESKVVRDDLREYTIDLLKDMMYKTSYQEDQFVYRESIASALIERKTDESMYVNLINVNAAYMESSQLATRINIFMQDIESKYFYALMRNDEVIEALKQATPENLDEVVKKYKTIFTANESQVKAWIEKNSNLRSEPHLQIMIDQFIEKHGKILFTGAPEDISPLLERYEAILQATNQELEEARFINHGYAEIDENGKTVQKINKPEDLTYLNDMLAALFDESINPEIVSELAGFKSQVETNTMLLIKQGYFSEYGLKEGSTIIDFNKLKIDTVRKIYSEIRSTISANLSIWASDKAGDMVMDMMTVSSEELAAKYMRRADIKAREKAFHEVATETELIGRDYRKARVVYIYDQQVKSSAFGSNESKSERREKRFAKAREFKSLLLSKLGAKGVDIWIEFLKKYKASYIKQLEEGKKTLSKDNIDELSSFIRDSVKADKELSEKSKGIDDIIIELTLCQNVDWLLDTICEDVNKADRDKLDPLMVEKGANIVSREREFWEKVKRAYKGVDAYPREVFEAHDRLLYRMSQITSHEKWSEELDTVIKALKDGASEEARRHSQLRDSRINRIVEKYGEGAEKIMPMLLKKEDIYKCILCHSDEDFEELYAKLEKTILPAVKLLWDVYSGIEEYFYQIVTVCFDNMYEKELTPKEWLKEFSEVAIKIDESKFVGRISRRGDELREDIALAKYSEIILKNTTPEMLKKKEFKEVVKECRANIEKNTAKLNELLATEGAEAQILSISVEMTLREKFPLEEISEELFKEKITFVKAKATEDKKADEVAHKVMTTLKEKHDYVVELRLNSQALVDERRKEIREATLKQSLGITPMINLMLNNRETVGKKRKIGDDEDIKTAEETIDSLYRTMPAYKRDVLKQIAMVRNEYRKLLKNKSVQEEEQADSFKVAIDVADGAIGTILDKMKGIVQLKQSIRARILAIFGASLIDEIGELSAEKIIELVVLISKDYIPKHKSQAMLLTLAPDIKKHPLLQEEYEQVLIKYSYDVFADGKEEFCKKAEEEHSYFSRAIKLAEVLEGETKDPKLLAGLYRIYYKETVTGEGFDLESIKERVKALLADEDVKAFVVDINSELGKVNDATIAETKKVTSIGIEEFKEKLNKDPRKSIAKEIEAYGSEEIKLLAIAAQYVGNVSARAGMNMVYDFGFAKKASRACAEAITQYRQNKTITVEPDYSRAYSALCKSGIDASATVNPVELKKAKQFVETCIAAKEEDIRDEIKKSGSNPMESILAMRKATDASSIKEIRPKNAKDLVDKLMETATREGAPKFAEALGKIGENAYKQRLFVLTLQNRSILDYSSTVSRYARAKGTKSIRVDEDGREELLALMRGGIEDKLSLDGDMLQKAYLQAFSYKREEKTEGKPTYVSRKEDIDIELLTEAVSLVDEMVNEELRIHTVRTAASEYMIRKSGNANAIAALDRLTPDMTLDEFIRTESLNDSEQVLYAGYLDLDEREKRLFCTAIAKRDLLDISKIDIMLNRFGMKDRDYVNKVGRYELIDQYIEGTMEPVSERSVFLGLLSSQIDDAMDFTEKQDLKNLEAMKGVSSRKTAVDWKLFARALQLVQRSRNERQLTDEQSYLQKHLASLSEAGAKTMDNSAMRRNIHNAGTRFTRFLARRTVEELKDQVPEYMVTFVRFLLPRSAADYLSDMKAFEAEDDEEFEFSLPGLVGFAADTGGAVSDFVNEDLGVSDLVQVIGAKMFGKESFDKFSDSLDEITGYVGIAGNVLDGFRAILNTKDLVVAGRKDEKKAQEDRAIIDEKTRDLPAAAKGFILQALQRNEGNLEQGRQMGIARQLDDLFNAVGEALEDVAEDAIGENIGGIVLKEAIHVVNFIRSYVHDIKNIADFYDVDKSVCAYADRLDQYGVKVDWKTENIAKKMSLFCDINGYENLTEMSEVVGMNIAQSILFSASKLFNGGEFEKKVAMAIMTALGLKDSIGDVSAEASEKLYAALMGEER